LPESVESSQIEAAASGRIEIERRLNWRSRAKIDDEIDYAALCRDGRSCASDFLKFVPAPVRSRRFLPMLPIRSRSLFRSWARVLLCAAPSLLTAHLAVAQEEPTQPAQVRTFPRFSKVQPAKPEPKEDPQAPQPEIRLLYLNAEWTTVLRDVAKDAGYELTLHDVPRGKYTRRDIKKHPAPEAIRILNQELEPQGYRILVTGRHMTVIGIQRSRVEYPRREIPTAGSVANQAQAPAVPGIQQAAATELPGVAPQLQAVDSRTAAAPINPARNQHPAGQVIPAGHQDQGTRSIQRAQFEQPALLGDQPQPAQQTTPPAVAEKLVTRKIVPMQRTSRGKFTGLSSAGLSSSTRVRKASPPFVSERLLPRSRCWVMSPPLQPLPDHPSPSSLIPPGTPSGWKPPKQPSPVWND
jgi:hypothetical protein